MRRDHFQAQALKRRHRLGEGVGGRVAQIQGFDPGVELRLQGRQLLGVKGQRVGVSAAQRNDVHELRRILSVRGDVVNGRNRSRLPDQKAGGGQDQHAKGQPQGGGAQVVRQRAAAGDADRAYASRQANGGQGDADGHAQEANAEAPKAEPRPECAQGPKRCRRHRADENGPRPPSRHFALLGKQVGRHGTPKRRPDARVPGAAGGGSGDGGPLWGVGRRHRL